MAASIKTQLFSVTGGGGWEKVMGQGIRSLVSTDEFVAHGAIQNTSTDTSGTLYVGFTYDNAAPDNDTDAGVLKFAIAPEEMITPNRIPCEAGVNMYIKCDQTVRGLISSSFTSTV